MLGSTYDGQVCSIARTLEVVGERWTLLVLREVFLGVRRFEEMQRDLGIARNVLSARLEKLVEHEVLEKVAYTERPLRHEYRLTERGVDLWPAIVALLQWGDKWAAGPDGVPVVLTHRGCGGELDSRRRCERCGADVEAREALAVPGPGIGADHPLLRRAAPAA